MRITKKAYAKINLTLEVINKRMDGFHNISSVMQSVLLWDTVTVEKAPAGIEGRWRQGERFGAENTAYRAAKLMLTRYNVEHGVKINIEKRIPVSAGLGGGSADAAAVIECINELFELGLGFPELAEAGLKIGADVPFCLMKGTALAEGLGERLTPVKSRIGCLVVLVKPPIDVSTKRVYGRFDEAGTYSAARPEAAIAAIESGNLSGLCESLNNSLEPVTAAEHPVIGELIGEMVSCGALGARMSGSGPTVYGLFEHGGYAEKVLKRFKSKYEDAFCCGFYDNQYGGD